MFDLCFAAAIVTLIPVSIFPELLLNWMLAGRISLHASQKLHKRTINVSVSLSCY